jgi:hypothetical protein
MICRATVGAKDADLSYRYADEVLHARFELGEPAIAKDSYCSKQYTLNVLKKNFYLDNKLICEYKI